MKVKRLVSNINKLPIGTKLVKHEKEWYGSIYPTKWRDVEEPLIGPISDPNFGTVVERLVILKRSSSYDFSE